jgi:acyl phosphate:glycerol-3-phosphate acyltransferase
MWLQSMPLPTNWIDFAGAFLLGYGLGSIPFGLILSRLGGAGDIRKIGSGNIGATNVLRTGRRDLALLTLFCDVAKGFAPVLFCRLSFGMETALFAAAGAFIGHLFPAWLNFRGGKGVATYLGVVSALYWPAGAVFCAVWLFSAVVSRYSSLSAILAAFVTPLVALSQGSISLFSLLLALTALLIARHTQNIRNLIAGRESKIILMKSSPKT